MLDNQSNQADNATTLPTITASDILSGTYVDLALDATGYIRYRGQVVAKLLKGDDFYSPSILLQVCSSEQDEEVKTYLSNFLYHALSTGLEPIFCLKNADKLSAKAKEVADIVVSNYGSVRMCILADKLKELDPFDCVTLRQLKIRFGRFHVYIPMMLKPGQVKLLLMLWYLQDMSGADQGEELLEKLLLGRTTLERSQDISDIYYKLSGYDFWGSFAIRVDITDRLSNYIQEALNWREGVTPKPVGAYNGYRFVLSPLVLSTLGVGYDQAVLIFKALGYVHNRVAYDADQAPNAFQIRSEDSEDLKMDVWTFVCKKPKSNPKVQAKDKPRNKKHHPSRPKKEKEIDMNSPFAVLLKLQKGSA